MSNFHIDEPTCEHARGYEPQVGDFVRLCNATSVWVVREQTDDGRWIVDPTRGPGWTWYQPRTVTSDHMDKAASADWFDRSAT